MELKPSYQRLAGAIVVIVFLSMTFSSLYNISLIGGAFISLGLVIGINMMIVGAIRWMKEEDENEKLSE